MHNAPITKPSENDRTQVATGEKKVQGDGGGGKQAVQCAVDRERFSRVLGDGVPAWLQLGEGEQTVQRKVGGEGKEESKRINDTGLPDRLKEGVEGLSGISLDDVHVHYNSSRPADVQALAYTKGTEIHVGPGQEQYLGHEAWHVVQQKQGRVKPTIQAKGVEINDDEGLEREADVMGERAKQTQKVYLPAAIQILKTTTSSTGSVIQGEFTVRSKLVPISSTRKTYSLDKINISSVQISNKRVPTKMRDSKDKKDHKSQGNHTIAWSAKLAEWQMFFVGNGMDVLKKLQNRAINDQSHEKNIKNNEWRLLNTGLLNEPSPIDRPIETWINDFAITITRYILANQRSSFAVSGGKSKYKGENISKLLDLENKLKNGETFDDDIMKACFNKYAIAILDKNAARFTKQSNKIIDDWESVLKTITPNLYKGIFGELARSVVEKSKIATEDAEKSEIEESEIDTMDVENEGDEESKIATEDAEKSEIEESEIDTMDVENVGEDKIWEDFVVRINADVNGENVDQYSAENLKVENLVISDVRPLTKTQNSKKMGSHIIPWSLKRLAWKGYLNGKTVHEALTWLETKLKEELTSHEELDEELKKAKKASTSIGHWTEWLSNLIEKYVAINQASPSSTYNETSIDGATESRGRGEPAALFKFKQWEKNNGTVDDLTKLNTAASALIDIPRTQIELYKIKFKELKKVWMDDLEAAFPQTVKQNKSQLEAVFDRLTKKKS